MLMVPIFGIQFKSTINKIRANKKSTNFAQDVDFDDTVDSFKRRNRAAVADFDDAIDSYKSRRNRAVADFDDEAGKSATSIKKSSYKVRILCLDFSFSDFYGNICVYCV